MTARESLSYEEISGRKHIRYFRRGRERKLHTQIILFHQFMAGQLLDVFPFERDLPVDNDVAPVGDLHRLVEVLLGHEDGEVVFLTCPQ